MINIELENFNSIKSICDWTELYVALNGDISKAEIGHFLNNNDYPEDDIENHVNSIWVELEKRNERYDFSPMTIDDVSIETSIVWNDYPEYILMLFLSLEGNHWQTQLTGAIFERICKEALEEYIGGQAKVVGFPNKVSVEEICNEIKEEFIQELPARYQDRKLDVVGWKKIDNRNNKLLILMQCAAGNNWRAKTTELVVDVWSKHINFGCTPTRAFGFSHVVEDDLFFDIGIEGGIIFDRLRLYRYLSNKAQFSDETLRPEVLVWCNNRIQTLVA